METGEVIFSAGAHPGEANIDWCSIVQEHCAAWSRALDKWVATMPYGVRDEADSSGWFVVRLVVRELPPPELSVVFADMISNLRATLDHIIWALVEESGNATHDKLTFPCVLDRKDWPSSLGSRLKNVPSQWIPAIEQAQPFTALSPGRHPIYVLHRLDIATKHRLLVPIEPSTFEWGAAYSLNRAIREDDRRIEKVAPAGGRLTDGVEMAVQNRGPTRDGDRICDPGWCRMGPPAR
jgi:hypothetical protein